MGSRPHPFELLFGGFRAERLPAIAAELAGRHDIDDFMLAGAALELMREMRPDDGLGDGIDDFVALVHAAYRFWVDDETTIELDEAQSRALCARSNDRPAAMASGVRYIQVAPRLIWGQLADDGPFEPLDGWFELPGQGTLRMVACFGVHPERPGLSVTVVEGREPAAWHRSDGSPLFGPMMPGGDAASLLAVGAPEELLLLGWRARRAVDAEGRSS